MQHNPVSRTPALVAAVALTLTLGTAPAFAAGPGEGADPVPSLVAGEDTASPRLVTGLSERATGTPATAALAHLGAHRDRYRVDPATLTELGTERSEGGRRTVRFQQWHGGVPVLGGQYLVHLTGEGDAQQVTSVAGRYFTGLTMPTTTPRPADVLRDAVLASVTDPRDRAGAVAEDHGAVVLPGGGGRLVRHFTVRTTPGKARPSAAPREVYVDTATGGIALAFDARTPFTTPAATPTNTGLTPAEGTAPDSRGTTRPIPIARAADGSYRLVDLTRPATISTYDANRGHPGEWGGQIPEGSQPVASPGTAFPAATGSTGATDAHLNAATVYDFYRDRLGRDGLDGKAGPIVSVVNVASGDGPFQNAFWDGSKMIYGGNSDKEYSYAAALDVAGHEMTHGVVEHTAGLIYVQQSGAMNEAIADYFGNAVEVTARGIPMTDPLAALQGESLCRTAAPRDCATRDMGDRHTTTDHYLGAPLDMDNGAVHYNSTIFSGALWDLRRTLDPALADRLVYRALTDYLTPTADFVDGRNAVLAAARDLKLGKAQLRTVAAAFDAHGIRAGWQQRIGLDSRTLLGGVGEYHTAPDAAGGHWVVSTADPGNLKPVAVFTGRTTVAGRGTRLSPDDGRRHYGAATDGRSAVWIAAGEAADGSWQQELLRRPLAGGPVTSLGRLPETLRPGRLRISGGDVAFDGYDRKARRTSAYLSRDGGEPTALQLAEGHLLMGEVSLREGKLAWIEYWSEESGDQLAVQVQDLASGRITARYPYPAAAEVVPENVQLAGGRALWIERTYDPKARLALRIGAFDGSGSASLLPASDPRAPRSATFTASDQAVTFEASAETTQVTNASLGKLWQLPLTGGTPERVSCNRGAQFSAVADSGRRVVWLDVTTGRTDLVTRDRPAVRC